MGAIQIVGLLVLTLAGAAGVWWVAYRFWWGGKGSGQPTPSTPVVTPVAEPGEARKGNRSRVTTAIAVVALALLVRKWRRSRAKRHRIEALRAECARLEASEPG